ncbi:NupC/NupG family nucleoside CNT transporter [Jeotgalibacillus soli]|uniref:NupC/NupG family nucleoside CNT transporter n=1 Tax=Jeotgalibacillus soli TaxID=889306 RepID=UPI00059758AA|nr:NupC/NupG family nucleoside CNT transporter [Jeotgalibacillus soli]
MNILWGLAGIIVILAIAFAFSNNKRNIKWRPVLVGLCIQLFFAFIVLETDFGSGVLQWMTNRVSSVIQYANEGINFVLGGFVYQENRIVFAINVLCVIIFFSSLISVLYYLKIMQVFVKLLGGGLSKLLGTRKAESMSAAANIFVGQTEAPLVIKPYIGKMTNSELFAVMTGGLASVAGSVLVGYALLGIPLDYLIAASFMAAPAGLVMSKMFVPETDDRPDPEDFEMAADDDAANVVDAAAKGASTGLQLALNVAAMLIAFIAIVAMLNGILGWIGALVGFNSFSLELILGYVFAPLAFAIGVPWHEAVQAGNLIGQKLALNEFVAYANFAPIMGDFSDKTVAIITFALCGFANISSLGILLGGLGNLAPERRPDIARLGLRAVLAGALASMLSASIAGMFF